MAKASRIPLEALFGNPVKAGPKISPDGRLFSFLAPDEGVLNVWVGKAADLGAAAKPVTKDRGRGIRSYFWAEDKKSLIYLQDKDGDENWHLYQVDVESLSVRDLTPHPSVRAEIIATDPNFPDEILVGMNLRDARLHDVYRINLKTGKETLEAENPGDVVGWLPDLKFKIRACKAMLQDGSTELRVRDTGKSPWRGLAKWGPDDTGGAHGFAPGNATLYVETSLGSDTTRLVEMSVATGEEKEIFRHPEVDIGPVMIHPKTFALQAVGFDVDRLEWKLIDKSLKADFKTLLSEDKAELHVVSRDDADEQWIVLYNRDNAPPAYHFYDRKKKRIQFLFSNRPELQKYALGSMKPVSFKARDGLRIRGYLTLPPGEEPKRLPLVLDVHGGPWVRDHWGFNPEAQWLANRGFAVLQVNYRGSTGYGKKFLHAGDREWGAKMQDDLSDAVEWAIREGIADPARVAIHGGSYGGYAALAGAAFTPDLYRCAVDVVGPSNLETLIRSIPPYWEPMRRLFDLRVGNIDTEPDFLRERSPLYKASEIRIPMLIAQGANDPRVKQAESEMIVKALREKGKDVEYLLFPDEGHGFAKPENRLKFYAATEKFLERHLLSPALSSRDKRLGTAGEEKDLPAAA